MARWLWALLVAVVLVALAVFFWPYGSRTTLEPPVASIPTPTPAPAPKSPANVAQAPAPAPQAPPLAQAPSPSPEPAARAPAPPAPPNVATAPGPSAPPAPPNVAEAPAPAAKAPTLAEAPAPTQAPTPEPESAPSSVRELIGAWASSASDCGRLFQRSGGALAYRQPIDKFAMAAIVASPQQVLLPASTCRVQSASQEDGALKLRTECMDSISYTSRTVEIKLRSKTELVYSPSGNPVLATTLTKCPL